MANRHRRDRRKLQKRFDQSRIVMSVDDIWDGGQVGQVRHYFDTLIADFARDGTHSLNRSATSFRHSTRKYSMPRTAIALRTSSLNSAYPSAASIFLCSARSSKTKCEQVPS